MVGQMGSRSSTFDTSKWNLIHMINIKTRCECYQFVKALLRRSRVIPPFFSFFFSKFSYIHKEKVLSQTNSTVSKTSKWFWMVCNISCDNAEIWGVQSILNAKKKLHTFVFSISSVNVNVFWLKFLMSIKKSNWIQHIIANCIETLTYQSGIIRTDVTIHWTSSRYSKLSLLLDACPVAQSDVLWAYLVIGWAKYEDKSRN